MNIIDFHLSFHVNSKEVCETISSNHWLNLPLWKTQRNLKMFFVQATESSKDFHSSPQAYWVTEYFPTCATEEVGKERGLRMRTTHWLYTQNKPASHTLNTCLALIFTNQNHDSVLEHQALSEQRQAHKLAGLWRTWESLGGEDTLEVKDPVGSMTKNNSQWGPKFPSSSKSKLLWTTVVSSWQLVSGNCNFPVWFLMIV